MKRCLLRGDVYAYGALLDETWKSKKHYSALISDPDLDKVYEHAVANGAVGGKISGCGRRWLFHVFRAPRLSAIDFATRLRRWTMSAKACCSTRWELQSWKMRLPDEGA